ncbi:uncharacterized protein [Hoplias malabaricus]|uniref:uncharacterized protein isoform X2 n=1 Tax=Hoplias malabaricus TaxID=27720 RepID=UPI0034624042
MMPQMRCLSKARGEKVQLTWTSVKTAMPFFQAQKFLEVFHQDSQDAVDQPEILTSCALSETVLDLLGHMYDRELMVNEREQSQASLASLWGSFLETDFNPKRCGTHQLQIPLRTSLSPCTNSTHSPQLSHTDKSPTEAKVNAIKEPVFFCTTSGQVGHSKLGSWWKHALESR